MRKFLTIFTLSLLAVSCIDNDYDLSDIDTDDIGIGDENSVFTCPLMTLRVAVADIVNEQGDLDGILAEADVWLPNRLPDGAEAVDVKRLTGGDGQQAQQAYVQTLLTALQEEIDADASDRKLEQIARQIYAEYREDFLPDYLPVDVDEAEYIAAFRTVYHQQATHDLIWENIELFAARYLTTNLRIDVRPFVLSGIDVGADVRDMIVGGDESKTSLSLFGDIATDLPVSFSAEPSFEAEVEGSDRTLFSFPSFTVFPTAEAPVEIEETSVSADALTVGCKRNVKPEMAEAKGKRMLIASELEEGMRLNTSIVKQLCSTDPIEAEKKYKDPFHFEPSHTLILYTNHLPRVGAIDDGTWRRLIVIPFAAKIDGKSDIKNYADYLFTNAGGAILKWMIEGAVRVIEAEFRIDLPVCVQEAIKAYRGENDWLGHFLTDRCDIGKELNEQSGALYTAYRQYCAECGEYTRSTTDFYTALENEGFVRQRTRKGSVIRGLMLRTDDFLD